MNCARCGNPYEPNKSFHVLCYDCYQEAGLSGDPVIQRMWKAVWELENLALTELDLKELAESVTFMRFIRRVLNEMDITMRGLWLKQEEEKYLSLTKQ